MSKREEVGGAGRRQRHDSLFKATFSEPRNALDLLRHVLPPALLEAIDPASLRHEPGSFVDEELAQLHSDVLLSARLRGQPALLYVLFEHQSSVDRFMPVRLARYVLRVWDRWFREHPDASLLPAVIPVVVHQGPGVWDGPRRLSQLVALPDPLLESLARFMPGLDMIVEDLGGLSPAALAARPGRHQVRVTLTLLRGVHDPAVDVADLLEVLRESLRALAAEAGGIEGLRRALLYIVKQRSGLDAKALVERVRRVAGPEVGEVAMSTYQELLDEGARNLVDRQLRAKFGDLTRDIVVRLAAATTKELEGWGERLLKAETLDEVFSSPRPRRATTSAQSRRKRRK